MAKQPFLPLFFGDFLASTAEWSGEERALYLLILGHAWAANSVPADPERLRRLLGYDKGTFSSAWPQVSTKFVEHEGRLYNERLEAHRMKSEELAEKRSKVGRKGAEKRWQSDGNSHGSGMAEASQTDGNSHGSDDGNCHSMSMPSIPSHPIPSDPTPEPEKIKTKNSTAKERGTRLADPFMLTSEMRQWASIELPGLTDLEGATREFVDYWRAIPGQRGRKVDWIATWRNRMREIAARRRPGSVNGNHAKPSSVDSDGIPTWATPEERAEILRLRQQEHAHVRQ